jgi:hypothetical protein
MLPDGLKRSAYHPNDGVCYFLPAAGALLLLLSTSSVFALQEETSLGDNGDFAGGIVSDVLGSVEDEEEENDGAAAGNDDDDTNKQIAAPITEQD